MRLALERDQQLQAAVEGDTRHDRPDTAIDALRAHLGQPANPSADQAGDDNLINVRVWSRNGKLVFESAPVGVGLGGHRSSASPTAPASTRRSPARPPRTSRARSSPPAAT